MAKKLKVDKVFKFLFDYLKSEDEEFDLDDIDERAQFLRTFFCDLDNGFTDDEYVALLKKNGIKFKKLESENGDYHESVDYGVIVEVNKVPYHFGIYDNGAMATDAVSYDTEMTEVVKKKITKTVYVNK